MVFIENVLIINGVNITPYIAKNGYKFQTEELHRENSKRNIVDGTATIDRIGRFAVVEVTIKEHLPQDLVHLLMNLQRLSSMECRYYNFDTGRMETGPFYLKIKAPTVKFFRNGKPVFSSFTLSLKATRRYGI